MKAASHNVIEHYENRILRISRTGLDLECFSPAINKHASCKNAKQRGQCPDILGSLSIVPLEFLQEDTCLFKVTGDSFAIS